MLEDWRAAQMPFLYMSRYSERRDLEIQHFMPTAPRKARRPASGAEIIARFRALAGK